MRQEGINTPTGGGAGVRNRLPRLAMAAVFLALAVAMVAVVAGSAQAQTTTTLSILNLPEGGDNIAVPGKLHPTDTLAGPDGTEYPVQHDDSNAYFIISRSGGGSLFSGQFDGVVARITFAYANGFGSPTLSDRGLLRKFSVGGAGQSWSLSEVIDLANSGPPDYAETAGPLTMELVPLEGQPYTVSPTENSICIILHDLNGNVTGDDCTGGS